MRLGLRDKDSESVSLYIHLHPPQPYHPRSPRSQSQTKEKCATACRSVIRICVPTCVRNADRTSQCRPRRHADSSAVYAHRSPCKKIGVVVQLMVVYPRVLTIYCLCLVMAPSFFRSPGSLALPIKLSIATASIPYPTACLCCVPALPYRHIWARRACSR
jgi:hypothetical protein